MKIALNFVVSLVAFGGLLLAPASQATNIAELPLKASVLAKPNVVFAMDESGSMDAEVMIDGNFQGWFYSNYQNATLYPGGARRTGAGASPWATDRRGLPWAPAPAGGVHAGPAAPAAPPRHHWPRIAPAGV